MKIMSLLLILISLSGCATRDAARAHAAYVENVAEINQAIANRVQQPILRIEAADPEVGITLGNVRTFEVYDPNAQPSFIKPERFQAPRTMFSQTLDLLTVGAQIWGKVEIVDTIGDVFQGVTQSIADSPSPNNSINVSGDYVGGDNQEIDVGGNLGDTTVTEVGGNLGDTDNSTNAGGDIINGDNNNNSGRFESPGDFDNDEIDNDGELTPVDPVPDPDP